jgi:RNA polymerase sigma-70 factor (ECF subfamily)
MKDYKEISSMCRKGNRKAQMDFYSIFYKSVYNSSLRILGNREEAEEVMQETFLKVFTKTTLIDDNAENMRRLLNRMAINLSIDIYRKRRVQFVEFTDKDTLIIEEDEENFSDVHLEMIKDAIQMLPDGYRLVFNLHAVENMKYEEIAEKLQITSSTVRTQYARAKQKLTTLIKTNYEGIFGK